MLTKSKNHSTIFKYDMVGILGGIFSYSIIESPRIINYEKPKNINNKLYNRTNIRSRLPKIRKRYRRSF